MNIRKYNVSKHRILEKEFKIITKILQERQCAVHSGPGDSQKRKGGLNPQGTICWGRSTRQCTRAAEEPIRGKSQHTKGWGRSTRQCTRAAEEPIRGRLGIQKVGEEAPSCALEQERSPNKEGLGLEHQRRATHKGIHWGWWLSHGKREAGEVYKEPMSPL